MEPSTVLVAVLTLGVAALLVWFEINSRRNEAQSKSDATDNCARQNAVTPLGMLG